MLRHSCRETHSGHPIRWYLYGPFIYLFLYLFIYLFFFSLYCQTHSEYIVDTITHYEHTPLPFYYNDNMYWETHLGYPIYLYLHNHSLSTADLTNLILKPFQGRLARSTPFQKKKKKRPPGRFNQNTHQSQFREIQTEYPPISTMGDPICRRPNLQKLQGRLAQST